MSQFGFLRAEWPDIQVSAEKAESLAYPDPRTSCFYARRTLELAVRWLYQSDKSLRLPYQDHLSALIHEATFQELVGPAVHAKVKAIKDLGNLAVHSHRAVQRGDSTAAVRELFHFCFWLARTYARSAAGRPAPGQQFDAARLPKEAPAPLKTLAELRTLREELEAKDAKLTDLLTGRAALDEEIVQLRAAVAAAKAANERVVDTHDYSEAETRAYLIDLLLKEAGWPLEHERDREFEVHGMPNDEGVGYVDYVLWGDNGKPLGLVEAKRTTRDPRVGQQQAKLYADCLEKQFGQRPVIFYSNGYDHWIWDDTHYPPRSVQGFHKKVELDLLIQRRATRTSLAAAEINKTIVERGYQHRAIRRVAESFENRNDRRALLAMATGSGKTRVVIALADLLMRCNWVKRVLFLADRVALVNQAVGAFKTFLPAVAPVNLIKDKEAEGRVFVSTYPTMMGLIEEQDDGQRRFGSGHFDLIVIDEAHRSVYQKYGAIFDYFDSMLIGLTATPRQDVDHNTYKLFNLEPGVPTDYYDLDEAVKDGYLVPPQAVSVPLKFVREGIRYDELSEDEKDEWDALEWNEEGEVPERVGSEALNKWLFNVDTVDKVLEHLMTHGQTVAGGDRLGKTIIFAKNQAHADFIAERFDANYPHLKGAFARTITFKVEYAQSLIDAFSHTDKSPHIAISVDMLDTGIDVPDVVNLVFFKLVRSKTKFWQMVGRGTRLRKGLFGPGQDKKFFYIFDFCGNVDFFSLNPEKTEGRAGESLGKRLFVSRVELIGELDRRKKEAIGTPEEIELRAQIADRLREEVAAMNLNNFVVRPKRREVERFVGAAAWEKLSASERFDLVNEVAGLPSELVDDDEEAKRFDVLIFRAQLALLRSEPGFATARERIREIVGLLEEQDAIPLVRAQMVLIERVQSEAFWQDVTVVELETVRRKLRSLIKLIEKMRRKPVYSDFEDEIGLGHSVALPGIGGGADLEKFRSKAREFLRANKDHLAIQRLRRNQPLTATDLAELERIMLEAGVGSSEELTAAKQESHGLGLFVRSLVGLDREAAKEAFSAFTQGRILTANQLEFLDLIIDHLTEQGAMEARRLFEAPFVDLHPHGVSGLFKPEQVDLIVAVLGEVQRRAVA